MRIAIMQTEAKITSDSSSQGSQKMSYQIEDCKHESRGVKTDYRLRLYLEYCKICKDVTRERCF